ncbi:ribonuclease HII [Candidatus Pacearchaeota archaeon]|nr:ribonuclease HII [Candidatus Pacearchaeota archaeon]
MYLLGIDDAGRGPILGPMYLAGVMIKEAENTKLKQIGAKDSKLLIHSQRIKIAKEIEKISKFHIVESSPEEIDKAVETINLNTLEAKKAAEIINKLNNKKDKIKVIVDCPSVNTLAWKNKMISFIEHKDNLTIFCEHKADFNHPIVSAASILAKVAREESVEKIKKQFGNIGSGYPSDPITIDFIKSQGKDLEETGIVRTSWATWKKLFPQSSKSNKQSKLF